jgi:hypothetical protein
MMRIFGSDGGLKDSAKVAKSGFLLKNSSSGFSLLAPRPKRQYLLRADAPTAILTI